MPSCGTKKMKMGGKVANQTKKMKKPARKSGGVKIRGTGAATKGTMARAANDIGGTYARLPVPWLGSTNTGK